MQQDDTERYAEYLAQLEQATQEDTAAPLEEVRQIRKQQLLMCDIEKQREMAKMLKQP